MALTVSIRNGMGTASISGTTVVMTGANESDFMHLTSDFMSNTNGGVASLATGDGNVTENSPTGLSVQIAAGTFYVPNSSYTKNGSVLKYWRVESDATAIGTITANASGSTRIDLVCVKVDTAVTPDSQATNVATMIVIAGTPGAGTPATPSNHLLLATVSITSGASSIVNANITDRREQLTYDLNDGYIKAPGTWTFSAGPTLTIPTDGTKRYRKGDKVKLKQGGAFKYFSAIGVASTAIVLTGGTDYTLTNSTITDVYYTHNSAVDFPSVFNHAPSLSGFSVAPSAIISEFTVTPEFIKFYLSTNSGTSNATITSAVLPVPVVTKTNYIQRPLVRVQNGGTLTAGTAVFGSGDTTVLFAPSISGATGDWVSSGNKAVTGFQVDYRY